MAYRQPDLYPACVGHNFFSAGCYKAGRSLSLAPSCGNMLSGFIKYLCVVSKLLLQINAHTKALNVETPKNTNHPISL